MIEDTVFKRQRKTAENLSLLSRGDWVENRCDDILEMMERYRRHKYIIPVEWIEELAEHTRATVNHRVRVQRIARGNLN